jgi:hypothetical protein
VPDNHKWYSSRAFEIYARVVGTDDVIVGMAQ